MKTYKQPEASCLSSTSKRNYTANVYEKSHQGGCVFKGHVRQRRSWNMFCSTNWVWYYSYNSALSAQHLALVSLTSYQHLTDILWSWLSNTAKLHTNNFNLFTSEHCSSFLLVHYSGITPPPPPPPTHDNWPAQTAALMLPPLSVSVKCFLSSNLTDLLKLSLPVQLLYILRWSGGLLKLRQPYVNSELPVWNLLGRLLKCWHTIIPDQTFSLLELNSVRKWKIVSASEFSSIGLVVLMHLKHKVTEAFPSPQLIATAAVICQSSARRSKIRCHCFNKGRAAEWWTCVICMMMVSSARWPQPWCMQIKVTHTLIRTHTHSCGHRGANLNLRIIKVSVTCKRTGGDLKTKGVEADSGANEKGASSFH